jgi:hypothetical protein
MDVFFIADPVHDRKNMFVRLSTGVFLTMMGGMQRVVEVQEGMEVPVFASFPSQVFEALGKAILDNAGLVEELRDRLFDTERVRDRLFDIVDADNSTLRKIAERQP